MKVLLLGGGGFISSCTEKHLACSGHDLTVLGRRGKTAHPSSRAVEGNRGDQALLGELAAEHFDAVVDFLCYDASGAREMVQAFAGQTARYVMISTGSVYWCTGVWSNPVDEGQYPVADLQERAPSPLAPGSVEFRYGAGKRQAEDLLNEASRSGRLSSVRLRFPVVGGPADSSGRYAGYYSRLVDGDPVLVPGGGYNSFRHLYVEDAAAAIEAVLDPSVPPGAFNVCSQEIISVRDLLGLMADLTGRVRPEVVAVSAALLAREQMSRLFAPFSCCRDQILDPSRAFNELGFAPVPYRHWLGATLAAEASNMEAAGSNSPSPWCSRRQERAFLARCRKELTWV